MARPSRHMRRPSSEPVDILVNDAGTNPISAFDQIVDAVLEEVLAVNLVAPFRLCRALAPGMARSEATAGS